MVNVIYIEEPTPDEQLLWQSVAEAKALDAIVGLLMQHCCLSDGTVDIPCVSSDEYAVDLLKKYGLLIESSEGSYFTFNKRNVIRFDYALWNDLGAYIGSK